MYGSGQPYNRVDTIKLYCSHTGCPCADPNVIGTIVNCTNVITHTHMCSILLLAKHFMRW